MSLTNVERSPLTRLYEAVRDDERMRTNGVGVLFGRSALGENGSPPRVVFVPVSGTYEKPQHEANEHGIRADTVDVVVELAAHVWGATFDQAWRLRTLLLAAVEAYTTDSDAVDVGFVGETWTDDEDSAEEGEAVVVRFAVRCCLPFVLRTTDPGYGLGDVNSVKFTRV